MKTHDLRLLGSGCCGWALTAAALRAGAGWKFFCFLGLITLLAACLGVLIRRHWVQFVALALGIMALLSATTAAHEHRAARGPLKQLAQEQAMVHLRVTVSKEPIELPTRSPDRAGSVLMLARATVVQARGCTTQVSSPVIVIAGVNWRHVRWREELEVMGRVKPAKVGEQAHAVVLARGTPKIVDGPPWPLRHFESLRSNLRESFSGAAPDARGLAPALVDGDVSQMPGDLKEIMNGVGMSHLNAVSGSNVTIVLVASVWIGGWFRLRRRGQLGVGLVTLVGFVALCHPEPSVIRAAAMGAVGVLGTSAGRPRSACPALGAAIVLLLMWDPWLSVNVGFVLSSLATLGLVLFGRPWTSAVTSRLPSWCAKPAEMAIIPLAASTPCLPVLVALNGSISFVSIPANMMAEPFVAPATLGGLGVLALGPLPVELRGPVALVVALPAWSIARIARIADSIPGGGMPWPSGVLGAVLIGAVLIVALFAWRLIGHARWWGVLSAGVVVALICALRAPLPGQDIVPGNWRYALCDVGQGDGGLIRTGDKGHAVAIDVGPENTHGMEKCLRRHRIHTLDAIFLSHYHADHVGALDTILTKFTVGEVFVTPVREESESHGDGERGAGEEVARSLRARNRTARDVHPGQVVTIADVTITVLWPKRVIHEGSVQNNASLVLDVATQDAHLLFLGDAETEADVAVQADIVRMASQRPYDVVKVGHHGSSHQSPLLYAAARARFGAIGVGENNDYGHPSKKLLKMLDSAGTTPCRSDTHGEVTFADTGGGLAPLTQKGAC